MTPQSILIKNDKEMTDIHSVGKPDEPENENSTFGTFNSFQWA